jgi:hypothetical protein
MPLTINLLHEEQALLKQRKRDPLKLGLYALGGVALLFVAYYGYCLAGSMHIQAELQARQADWARQQPKAKAAAEQDKILSQKLGTANLVSQRINKRFYWAPILADLQRTVTPNVQLIDFSGSSDPKDEKVTMVLEGLAAGPRPRAAAEQFRVTLSDVLGKSYKSATATFRSLDETASSVALEGKTMPTARFTIDIKLDPTATLPVLAAAPERRAKHS